MSGQRTIRLGGYRIDLEKQDDDVATFRIRRPEYTRKQEATEAARTSLFQAYRAAVTSDVEEAFEHGTQALAHLLHAKALAHKTHP